MIRYNPKDWFGLIFQFHKSDTFRKLFLLMLCLAIYSCGLVYVDYHYVNIGKKNLSTMYSLLGFVISLLLVFRTNTAYDRWWEGRKAWGSLLNNCRNIAIKLGPMINRNEDRYALYALLSNFSMSLKDHLRGSYNYTELIPCKQWNQEELALFKHNPNFFALKIQEHLRSLPNKEIGSEEFLYVSAELNALTDITGICERIKKTPIPYSYSLFIKKFIFLFVMSMPFAFIEDFGYGVAFLVTFVFYALVSLELIAEEIEDPFGEDVNDLPLEGICKTINNNCAEILRVDRIH